MSDHFEIITTPTGYFKPGLKGRIVGGGGERAVYLGPDGALQAAKIPEFTILLEGAEFAREFCQYGRDFVFPSAA
jgi:hypothetical protein